ncbi:hypothetical protein ASD01_29680 [Ensifer sp. Root423]|uniref:hypothetical protein n=1 Tax=Ensifer sp. Root423 TaxID=1736534 RepID=UPI000714E416|nr:hypothetical protein [Ensifer sp. Root423]KQX20986.1 hypothetical protein ASD01_29680 [Ensifer sp. Root423]
MTQFEEADEATQRRWMQNLLGRDNVERLEKQTERQKAAPQIKLNFRPKPVIVSYEFYRIPDMIHLNWRINRLENGRCELFKNRLDESECRAEVKSLRAKGFTCRELTFGAHSRYANRSDGKGNARQRPAKTEIMDRLKDFKI